jgi:DNA-binding winged helix-turn-helix (wHTH) protein/tetratricopeptide (TPR) repeat protein
MIYRFDEFSVNTDTLECHRAGVVVSLEAQVFSLLLVFIEHRERVLSKDALIELVWHGRPVSDTAVTSRIKSLRKALGDDGRAQRYIRTIHGRGYRFVGEIQEPAPARVEAADSPRPVGEEGESKPLLPSERPAILILPFVGLNQQPDLPMLAEGFAHDLTLSLSRLHWLRVISRMTAFQFSNSPQSRATIAERTGARYCLSGSIERIGDSLALQVELGDLDTEAVLWMDRLHGRLGDLHQIRADICDRAASALEMRISALEAQRARVLSPENLDAWSNYHLGIDHMYRFTANDNARALGYFQQAMRLEPGFARAHAGHSFASFQNAFNQYDGIDVKASRLEARRSAERSVELDHLDPLANFVMGRSFWLESGAAASIPWMERSLAVNPNFAQGYYSHGLASVMAGDRDIVLEDSTQALAISPLDPFLYGFHGIRALYYIASGDYANAASWAVSAANQPGAITVMDLIAAAATALHGEEAEARRWIARAASRKPGISQAFFFQALPFCAGETRERISRALESSGLPVS